METLSTYKSFFFVGIGGIGMSALARYFHASGVQVSGYDRTSTKLTRALEQEGVKIIYQDEISEEIRSLSSLETLVVYTPAIKKLKLLDYFEANHFTILKRAKVLGLITKQSESIAVAGTHGKTTTSTLLAHLATEAGLPISCFLGGISENFQSNFHYAGDKYSVVEADEYDRSFLNLSPDWAILTSIDADHLDIYGDAQTIEEGFFEFSSLVLNPRQLFVRKGIAINRDVVYYAVNEQAEVYSDNLAIKDGWMNFSFHSPWGNGPFRWKIPGTHNVENATAAIGLLLSLGVPMEKLQQSLEQFKGIRRRYTTHEFADGKILIDDYAHHPTELNAVIGSIKTFYPDKKLLVVFQPHLYSRTRDFAGDFAQSLSMGDQLLLLDIYPAREVQKDYPGITSSWLLEQIVMNNKDVAKLESALELVKSYQFDILLLAGAGDIDTLYDPVYQWMEGKNSTKE